MEEYKKRLFEILNQEAFFKEEIILSSGKKSDYYIDARRITLSPEGVYLSASIILAMVKDENIDAIGGPTLGADPLVGAIAALSFKMDKPLRTFIIRKVPKSYGTQKQIEGPPMKKNARVVVLDDVVTTGKSIIESIDVLKKIDVVVTKAICLVDRNEGAREALRKFDCPLVSIFTAQDFLK